MKRGFKDAITHHYKGACRKAFSEQSEEQYAMNYHQRHYGEKTLRLKPIEQHNTTLFHSRRYHVTRDYMGHYTLNDLKERKAVYLQGDDATQFEKEFNERIDKDALCEDYDPVMSGPCKVV